MSVRGILLIIIITFCQLVGQPCFSTTCNLQQRVSIYVRYLPMPWHKAVISLNVFIYLSRNLCSWRNMFQFFSFIIMWPNNEDYLFVMFVISCFCVLVSFKSSTLLIRTSKKCPKNVKKCFFCKTASLRSQRNCCCLLIARMHGHC